MVEARKLISIEKELAEDLFTSKIHIIERRINDILLRWGESSIDSFFTNINRYDSKIAEKDSHEMERLVKLYSRLKKLLRELNLNSQIVM